MIIKIYFIENSFNYNADNLNDKFIAGSEKVLINITNELAKDNNLIIKVFNNTSKPNFNNFHIALKQCKTKEQKQLGHSLFDIFILT